MLTLKDKINRILGNNVRLLLPSYWWKRAFGLVVDEIDSVEKLVNSSQTRVDKLEKRVTSQDTRIEEAISLVEESAIPLVESKEDLESLDSPLGTIARVAYEGNKKINILECKTPTKEDTEESIIQNWSEYTRITKIESTVPVGSDTNILFLVQFFNPKEEESVAAISFDNGACIATLISSNNGEQHTRNLTLDEFNVVLQQKDYRLLKVDYSTELEVINFITNYMTFYGPPTVSDAYIKGETWTRLLKEGDVTGGLEDIEERVSNIEEFFEEGAKLNLTIKSNQGTDNVISEVKAAITFNDETVESGSGVIGLPVFTDVTITFPEVEGYKTPEPLIFTTGALPISYSVTYETEVVTVGVYTWDGSKITSNPMVVFSYGEIDRGHPWCGDKIQRKIPFGAQVKVSIEHLEGYVTPDPITFVASQKSREINLIYSEMVGSWIMIDQNISDPDTMISGDINGEHIKLIRKNSHRYVGKYTADGTVTVCQLDDSNSNYYADGETAVLTGEEGDVFMKLPKFWYKVINIRPDAFSIGFYYGESAPNDEWKTWEGNELIGAYMATKSSSKTMSISGKESELMGQDKNVHNYNGNGFSQIKWKHHNIMAILYCAMYGNTNSQEILGYGHSLNNKKPNGQTNELGMSDSVNDNGNENIVNFWGLENWWGDLSQVLCNTSIQGNWVNSTDGLRIDFTEDDGTIRTLKLATTGYVTRFVLGEHIDMFPSAFGGSGTTGYCDYCGDASNAINYICTGRQSNWNVAPSTGIFCFNFHANGFYNDYVGSRLAFKGNIIINNDSTAFKALTAIN